MKKPSKVMTVMGRKVIHHSPPKFPASSDPGVSAEDEKAYQEAMKAFKGEKGGKSIQPAFPASSRDMEKELEEAEKGKQTKPRGYFKRGY